MCGRLLDAGYTLCVYDRDPKATAALAARGARVASSPGEVASAAEIVLMSLPTPDIVKAVALGENGVAHGNRVRTLIDLSTTGPGASTIIAKGLGEHNITFVDAPVSGGIAGAKGGTLAVMVSCPKDIFAPQVEPILRNFGKLFYTGEKPGLAQTAKLVNNLL
ncbi:MAG: NAD(P)-dependent oxidoreductase, partial [Tardiphaga sp.]